MVHIRHAQLLSKTLASGWLQGKVDTSAMPGSAFAAQFHSCSALVNEHALSAFACILLAALMRSLPLPHLSWKKGALGLPSMVL
jgi:hypothetical protein